MRNLARTSASSWAFALCAVVLLAACNSADEEEAEVLVASAVVGSEGGRIEGEGMALDIPGGALQGEEELAVYRRDDGIEGHALLSPVFRFEPDGLEFAAPATVTLTVPEGTVGVVFWSRPDGSGYDPIGVAEDGVGTAEVTHFSEGMVDSCSGLTACYCSANDEQGGLACKHNPGEQFIGCEPNTTQLFLGAEGGSDTGFARREVMANMCYCGTRVKYAYDTTNTYQDMSLCRRPWTFLNGHWECHTDKEGQEPATQQDNWGLRGYKRPDDGKPQCTGYWIDYPKVNHQGEVKHASGSLYGCMPIVEKTEWRSVDCTLFGCSGITYEQALEKARAANLDAALLGSATTEACAVPDTELPPTEMPPTEPPPTEMPPTELPATP